MQNIQTGSKKLPPLWLMEEHLLSVPSHHNLDLESSVLRQHQVAIFHCRVPPWINVRLVAPATGKV